MKTRGCKAKGWALAALSAVTVAIAPETARAAGPVSPTGKGIAGGLLLGAEIGTMPLAIAGVEPWWAYALGGGLGAAGGAVGGYFVEQTGSAEPSLYMLAGGLALIIPTVVLTLNATAYQPETEEGETDVTVEGEAAPGGAAAPAGVPGAAAPGGLAAPGVPAAAGPGAAGPATAAEVPEGPLAVHAPHRRDLAGRPALPMSFVSFELARRGAEVRAGVPTVAVANLYSDEEVGMYGARQATLVYVPIAAGRF